ncbi:MAG: DUF3822 family protein [Tannerella sp.]|jgi:hypothetical protein|nr:DUF3822 family protein [Tannerella sp.]
MTIRVPNTLTADNSWKYEVSIRLLPDGLSFSGYIPFEKDSFFIETILFDPDLSMGQSLKNMFFNNPCFSYTYKSLYVICVSGKYTLAPDSVFSEKDKELLFSFCHQEDESLKILIQPLKALNSSLLFGIDKGSYEFLVRSLAKPLFIHSLSSMLILWQKKSLTCYPKQMYIVVHAHTMDALCLERGELLFVNSFDYETDKDIIYYIMYICRQLGFNQLEDCLSFCGDKAICRSVMSVIGKYVRQSDYLRPKIKDYLVPVDQDFDMDIVALMECGL